MSLAALSFLNPWLLAALASLPLIYWLLKTVPPRPRQISFPPTRILTELKNREKTPAKTPWWLLLLRLAAAALVILALAGPIFDPSKNQALKGDGPIAIVVDNSWAAAAHWPDRVTMIERFINRAEAQKRPLLLVPTTLSAKPESLQLLSPNEARTAARALKPQPFAPDHVGTLSRLT
ncbi:MAG: BatA domain-containing protein, partial [Alphaproteobacteria bacterium]|nr:BatA domain-containing protein [Alphaproteobacteria bacterium]